MMKWGRKKSSSSSMNPHLISHGFPKSWFSMFKKTSDSTKPSMEITKGEEKKNSFSPNRALRASWTEGQYHGEVDDSYRRLSFGDERCDCQYLKSVRYDPDDGYEVHSLSPRCSRHRGMALERRQFAGRRQISELPQHVEILQENFKCQEGNESDMSKILGRRATKDVKPRKMHQRTRDEKHSELPRKLHAAVENSLKAIEKDIFEFKPMRIIQTEKVYQKSAALQSCKQRRSPTTNSKFRTIQEGGAFGTQNLEQLNAVSKEELLISEWQNLKDKKIKEILLKSKEQKKNVLVCRESPSKRKKQVRKVRVYTPRTAARIECKIRAIEDLKKAKMKTNKVRKQRPVKEGISFDSFAVVKSSIDPQEDFKISMAEMITAIGIRQPQDLEELLACYLTLNCDEYHDLIIKVFRQVWFELNHVHFVQAMQTKYGCNGNNQLS